MPSTDRQESSSDIPRDSWVDRILPVPARPYARLMRLDRPIGTWLLLLPCWWGLALAWQVTPDADGLAWLWVLFTLGAIVMRGAGCTVNDLWDRDFDRRVARTADRPIASGAISVRRALVFLCVQLLFGLVILLQLNETARVLGVAVLVLVATYPLAKRVTSWPQFVLGLAFNWGALMGWVAVTGELAVTCVVLYVAGIAWTLGYDTIYAHQDKEDDAMIGVKSSALALGDRTRPFLFAFYAVTIAGLVATGLLAGLSWVYFLILLAGAAHLGWQAHTVDIDDPRHCLARFHSNRDFGLLITVAIFAG